MSKGSKSRVTNTQVYADNYDNIFGNGVDSRKWGHAYSADEDSWQACERAVTTREEAIAEANDYYEGDSFAICRCDPIDVEITLPSADDIAEQMAESAGDNYGWVEDYPDVSGAALNELNKLLKDWAHKHVTTHYWQAGNIETIEGETT